MTIREIRNRYNHFVFVAGLVKLYELGQVTCKAFTDSYIEDAYQSEIKRQSELPKGKICVYTPEVIRDMLIVAREMSNLGIVDLINQVGNEEIFDNPARPISYSRMEEIASWGITTVCDYELFEEFNDNADMTDDEMENFCVPDHFRNEDEDDDI